MKLETAGVPLRVSLNVVKNLEKSVQQIRRTGSSAVKKMDLVLRKKKLATLQKICNVPLREKTEHNVWKGTSK